MKESLKVRLKNPYFWLGLIGVLFTSIGVDFNTLTNWSLLADSFFEAIKNPVLILSVISALLGVFVDPSTKGLKDNK